MSRSRSILGLIVFLLLCVGAGALGGIATSSQIDGWYAEIAKPTWNPPSWVFAPVWTTLYVLMAISGWLVWRQQIEASVKGALMAFGTQLVLNAAWSFIFFGAHLPGWAFVEIIALWIAIVVTLCLFFPRSKVAGWLLVPYLLWVSFASVLNFTIWQLNR